MHFANSLTLNITFFACAFLIRLSRRAFFVAEFLLNFLFILFCFVYFSIRFFFHSGICEQYDGFMEQSITLNSNRLNGVSSAHSNMNDDHVHISFKWNSISKRENHFFLLRNSVCFSFQIISPILSYTQIF